MSLETKVTRRDFLYKAGVLVGGVTLLNILGCTQEPQPELQAPEYDFISPENLSYYGDLVRKESAQFDLLTLANLSAVSSFSELSALTSIIPQTEKLVQFGINSIAFGEDEDYLLMIIKFAQDIRLGKPFSNLATGTPWPAALFLTDKDYTGYTTPVGYGPDEVSNGSPMEFLYMVFPSINKLRGIEFTIMMSSGLLNVQGNELNRFVIPYRFMVPKAPAALPPV